MAFFLPPQMEKALARRVFEWHVDFFDGRRIQGWVGCRKAPRTACLITFRGPQGPLGTTFTTISRPDVTALGYEPAGFRFVLDRETEGPVAVSATNPVAATSWITLERGLSPTGCGVVESVSVSRIRGWAAPPRRWAGASAKIALWRGDAEIASTNLSILRGDIAEAFDLDDSLLGFDLRLPLEATIFSPDAFTLKAHYGDQTFVIRDRLSFAEKEAGFQRALSFDLSSQRWV